MLLEVVLLAATPAPTPSFAPNPTPLGVFAAGLPGFLTGTAAVIVALFTQRMAQKDRLEALEREDRARQDQRERDAREDRERRRQERATVHNSIVAELLKFSRASADNQKVRADSRALALALSGILTRLGNSRVYYDSIAVLNAAQSVGDFSTRMKTMGLMQLYLDEWFVQDQDDLTLLDGLRTTKAAAETDAAAEAAAEESKKAAMMAAMHPTTERE